MHKKTHLHSIARAAALSGLLLCGSAMPSIAASGHEGHGEGVPAEKPEGGHGSGYGAHGGWPEPGTLGGDFSLTDHTGRKVTLEDFKGKATAFYFGYTQCGDICPIIGTKLGMAADLLGDKADQVNIAMVSVDDRNDGPEQLAAFVAKQHPRLIGLSGTRKEIYDVAARYRVRRDYVAQNQVAKEGDQQESAGASASEESHGGHGSHGGHATPAAPPEHEQAPVPRTQAAVAGTDAAPGKRILIRSASDDATRLHNMAMAHTTHIYLLNRNGQVVRYIYPSLTPEQLAKRLSDLIQDG
ncbi:cytochrome oxidase Cu insertion factor (SCO1/SenC/PrrC family) [Skermanella aerolata]|uniref:SCO family protein n=1 Tax=Skermanella aerolata TaxID=393310 RepID=UPI003D237CC9